MARDVPLNVPEGCTSGMVRLEPFWVPAKWSQEVLKHTIICMKGLFLDAIHADFDSGFGV